MDFEKHNWRMVRRFLWLERVWPEHAEWAIQDYIKHPSCPNPHILEDMQWERDRRAQEAKNPASAAT